LISRRNRESIRFKLDCCWMQSSPFNVNWSNICSGYNK